MFFLVLSIDFAKYASADLRKIFWKLVRQCVKTTLSSAMKRFGLLKRSSVVIREGYKDKDRQSYEFNI